MHRGAGEILWRPTIFVAFGAVAGESLHGAVLGNEADAMIAVVGHNDIVVFVRGNTAGVVELRLRAFAVFEALLAAASKRRDHVVAAQLADAVVTTVDNIDVALLVARHTRGAVEFGVTCGAVRKTLLQASRDGGHLSVFGTDLADCVVLLIRHDEVTAEVDRQPCGAAEERDVGDAVVIAVAAVAAGICREVLVLAVEADDAVG